MAAAASEQRTAVIHRPKDVRTLTKAIRRTLEHDWEHRAELASRPGGPAIRPRHPGLDAPTATGLSVEWSTALGAAVLDPGNPVGQAVYVGPDGSVSAGGGTNPVSGYTLIEEGSLDEAVAAAQRNPLLAGGGCIEVAETFTMG